MDKLSEKTRNNLQRDLQERLEGEVQFDAYTRVLYSTDASNYQIEPLGVVLPRDDDEICAVVEIAKEYGASVIARGAGSSMAGQSLGYGIILDCSKYLNQIHALFPEEPSIEVGPGVVLAALNRIAAGRGLMFGPDPASADRATIGGMVGNNATGAHSLRYGLVIDHLLEAEVVLSDGSVATFGPLEPHSLKKKQAGRSLEGEIYRQVFSILDLHHQAIRERWPRTWRRASGYSLNYLIDYSPGAPSGWFDEANPYPPTAGLNLAPLLCSSEGTLGILRRAKLRLVPKPGATVLKVLSFDSVCEAADATPGILETRPDAVEVLPRMLLTRAREIPAYARKMGFAQGDPAALLVVEYASENVEQAISLAGRLPDGVLLEREEDQADLWAVRKVGLGLLMSIPGDTKPITFIEDVAVPVDKLGDYVRKVDTILQEHGTTGEWYAHASAGCLHLRPMVNLKTAEGVEKMRCIADAVVDLVIEMEGSISGEHGDGLSHTEYNERLFGADLANAFRQVKDVFDPDGVLNPGKVVPASSGFGGQGSLTSDLRYGEAYRTVSPATFFSYAREGSFASAVESCTGLGVCRKVDGLMCPSYQVTREEMHSTRGRANALRAAISGVLPLESLTSNQMYEILDLCLACKGCKAECPTAVDMARLKSEFLALHRAEHGVPLRDFLFAHIAKISRYASLFTTLLNFSTRLRGFRWIQEKLLGIARQRTLPQFANVTFSEWFSKHPQPGYTEAVVLFLDTYTQYQYPEVGIAAVEILEAAGYRVELVSEQGCCGRPMISKGLLKEAKALAESNIRALTPYVEAGVSIIGLEPSCIITLRDEYLDFFPHDPRAKILAENSFTFEEFLVRTNGMDARPIDRIQFREEDVSVLFHNHCYTKALIGSKASRAMFEAAGISFEEVESGCCGMAGAFGYEKEHYPFSMEIAEDRLLPAVRHGVGQGVQISASGLSCRTQIHDGAGVVALHPAQILTRLIAGEED
ncbi:MAG: FAD-binding protein [Anaerolineales bacterium]|nr:FAD-binding protein [Anaerolineales bacterium]